MNNREPIPGMVMVEMIPSWSASLRTYQYRPNPQRNDIKILIKHCHPQGLSWVNYFDEETIEWVDTLAWAHGYALQWIEPLELELMKVREKVSKMTDAEVAEFGQTREQLIQTREHWATVAFRNFPKP